MKILLLGVLGFVAFSTNASTISITPTDDGTVLADAIVGTGIEFNYSTINYFGTSTQAALFSDGYSSGLGIDQGIMLTTGMASTAIGPNSASNSGTILGTAGDAQLSQLIGGSNTYDANYLEFEFTTSSGDLFFDFIFASEEYNEYLTFNDPFALFIDGVNYALAPDGSVVSVSSINCGSSGTDISSVNCQYFNNNLDQNGGVANTYNIEYDGFTDRFQASILGLSAGSHQMKFVIADALDHQLDSAVFIASNSFSDGSPTQVPVPATLALFSLGLLGLGITRKKKQANLLVPEI